TALSITRSKERTAASGGAGCVRGGAGGVGAGAAEETVVPVASAAGGVGARDGSAVGALGGGDAQPRWSDAKRARIAGVDVLIDLFKGVVLIARGDKSKMKDSQLVLSQAYEKEKSKADDLYM